jgi:sulfonate transport system substrate-binding protein
MHLRSRLSRAHLRPNTAWLVGLAVALGCNAPADVPSGPRLAFDAPIPTEFARVTRLVLGDPTVKKQLQLSGTLAALPFDVDWQNISGGPNTIEAFRAGALDGGAVGDTPPIHAALTGLRVKIIMVQTRDRPTYRLGIAPGQRIRSIEELRGKRIAYSPGQAQGALVQRILSKAGLSRSDVQLVEIASTEFKDALTSRQVDAAPLSGAPLLRYLGEYAGQGASAIDHAVRDNLSFFYVRSSVLEDPNKAAALQAYVRLRAGAQRFAVDNPELWSEKYYVQDQGLNSAQARSLVEALGRPQYPTDWSEAIAHTQETIDLMAQAGGKPSFDARELFDLRFQASAEQGATAAGRSAADDGRLSALKGRAP